jgi:hypothetical protein
MTPTPSIGGHQYIRIGKYHRNPTNAEAYVLGLFRQGNPQLSPAEARGSTFQVTTSDKTFEVQHRDALIAARQTGTVENLRSFLNRNDPYFVFTMGIAADGEGPSVELGFAGQKLKLECPMRQMAIEAELTADILDHRRKASEFSLQGYDGFRTTAMHFRAYILSSCALLEAFLNRHVLIDRAEGRTSPEIDELEKPCSVERKFELWLRQYTGEPISAVKAGVEWDHFSELRRLRNSLMHATVSMLGISLRDTARQLNLVRHGVGGMIGKLRTLQQLPPVPFAESLETAPECTFQSQVK